MKKTSSSSSGVGLGSLLGVALIVLKLTDVIDWRWIWVVAPFWIGIVAVVVILIIAVIAVILDR